MVDNTINPEDIKLIAAWNEIYANNGNARLKVFEMSKFDENVKDIPPMQLIDFIKQSVAFDKKNKFYYFNEHNMFISFDDLTMTPSPINFRNLCYAMIKKTEKKSIK